MSEYKLAAGEPELISTTEHLQLNVDIVSSGEVLGTCSVLYYISVDDASGNSSDPMFDPADMEFEWEEEEPSTKDQDAIELQVLAWLKKEGFVIRKDIKNYM